MKIAKHSAKIAGQARHNVNTIGAMIAGMGIANTEEVGAAVTMLETAGIPPQIQVVLGILVVLGAQIASWKSKAKRVGEGDFG